MRKEALSAISDLVAKDDRVVFVGSDLGAGTVADIRKVHPDRVLMEGIAEQHLVGFAAGLALEGFVPFVHTIGTFLTRRALEQVVVDVALHDLPVRLIASGGGMVYAPLGPTHQAIDDFALMRAIPNMSVLAPADPLEVRQVVDALAGLAGPAYVRLGKGGENTVTDGLEPWELGQPRIILEGVGVAILTTGVILHECIEAAATLRALGVDVGLVHLPTISPLPVETIRALSLRYAVLLVVEEHIPTGGLGSAVAEVIAAHTSRARLSHIHLPARYATNYGSQRDHWDAEGLTASGISERVLSLVGAG